jgi:hypothetical protein
MTITNHGLRRAQAARSCSTTSTPLCRILARARQVMTDMTADVEGPCWKAPPAHSKSHGIRATCHAPSPGTLGLFSPSWTSRVYSRPRQTACRPRGLRGSCPECLMCLRSLCHPNFCHLAPHPSTCCLSQATQPTTTRLPFPRRYAQQAKTLW